MNGEELFIYVYVWYPTVKLQESPLITYLYHALFIDLIHNVRLILYAAMLSITTASHQSVVDLQEIWAFYHIQKSEPQPPNSPAVFEEEIFEWWTIQWESRRCHLVNFGKEVTTQGREELYECQVQVMGKRSPKQAVALSFSLSAAQLLGLQAQRDCLPITVMWSWVWSVSHLW